MRCGDLLLICIGEADQAALIAELADTRLHRDRLTQCLQELDSTVDELESAALDRLQADVGAGLEGCRRTPMTDSAADASRQLQHPDCPAGMHEAEQLNIATRQVTNRCTKANHDHLAQPRMASSLGCCVAQVHSLTHRVRATLQRLKR